ncbi:lactonase family protein [Niallia sp. XMNu-256]|uniref:lactonase family protein n=1 Tax=Niallia sp. XMNu-256 TaxID=3082444 RepID=UPI0030D37DF0
MEYTNFTGFIGTYTKGESKGIYSFVLDTQAGKISDLQLAGALENPTYITISKDQRFLYSVIKENTKGGTAAFKIDPNTAKLSLINTQLTEGSPPCHVNTDSQQRFLFSTNYHKGTVESYLINQHTGEISKPSSIIKHEGSGPDERQEKAHTHYAGMTPDDKYVVVVELGSDKLLSYEVKNDGQLIEVSRLDISPGSGPRHLAFHPLNKKVAYIMTEFSSEIIVLNYQEENGSFSIMETHKTIPADFTENNQGSAIHTSSDGKFIYVGNRGHNSIAIFKSDPQTGRLDFVTHVSTEGDWPRDFALDPTERFLIASNQNSGNLVLFSRDPETGLLKSIQKDISVPDPVCVKFL